MVKMLATKTFNTKASELHFTGVVDTVIYEFLEWQYVRTQLGVDGYVIFWVYETFGWYLRIWNDGAK